MQNKEKNKKIILNTSVLYIRMLFSLGVSLYTSRIILKVLGFEDFGIYSVVGGIVILFSFLNGAMASSTQRFLTIELGKKNILELKRIFRTSVNIHVLIVLIVFVLAETIGLWFLNYKLIIPIERVVAANWVYQFSLFSLIISVLYVPYFAVIIAHEKMKIFARISVLEVLLKLIIVLILFWYGNSVDKLIYYSLSIFIISTIISFIYIYYSSKNFKECDYRFYWNLTLLKKMTSFASWNLLGNLSIVTYNQGVNILLNIFFGPSVNAARAISFQVQGAIYGFVSNFQIALNPAIIKSFSIQDYKYMHQLIFQGAKYSFFLLFIISVPVILETNLLLGIWLEDVPEFTVIFTRLILINILVESISGSLAAGAQASGRIKLYQGIVGSLWLLIIPISYLFLKLNYPPQVTFVINIVISIIAFWARLSIISPLINLSVSDFLNKVIFKIIPVAMIALVIPLFIRTFMNESIQRLIIVGITLIFSTVTAIYVLGISQEEREIIKIFVKKRLKIFFRDEQKQ